MTLSQVHPGLVCLTRISGELLPVVVERSVVVVLRSGHRRTMWRVSHGGRTLPKLRSAAALRPREPVKRGSEMLSSVAMLLRPVAKR